MSFRRMAGRFVTGHKHLEADSPAVRAEMFGEMMALFDSVSAVVVVSDAGGKIVFWNQGAARTYQWQKEDAIGRPWFSLLNTRVPESFAAIMDALRAQGRWEGELAQERKDGTTVICAASVALRKDEAGAPVAMIVIANDIGMSAERRGVESDREYHESAEILPEGIVVVADGRIVSVNPAGAAIAGVPVERIVGSELMGFIPGHLHDEVRQRMKRILDEGARVIMHEEAIRLPGGRLIEIEFSAGRVSYLGAPAVRYIFRDISQRKRLEQERADAEKRLREQWERMEQLIDTMPVMMNAVDGQGKIVVWNRECARVTGYSSDEIVGNPEAFRLFFPDSERRRKFLAKWSARNGDFRDWEWPIKCKDGSQRVISWSNISASFPRPGLRAWAFGADVTERKIAEEKIAYAHRQLLDFIEFLPDATFAVNNEQKVVAWNHAMENLTGVSKTEIIGKGPEEYSVPFYGKAHVMLIGLMGASLEDIRLHYGDVKRADGVLYAERFFPFLNKGKGVFVQIKVAACIDKDGAFAGGIETLRDITEQKTYEAMLEKDKKGFERLLKDRTRQLLNAQKELSDARHLSEIGMLAATVAHELRNPLAAMRMGAYNIRRKGAVVAVKAHLDIIEKKIKESDQIINNLLNYSRIKSPMFEYVNLRELVDEVIASVKARFYDWKAKVRLEDEAGGITVPVDPLQVKEMLGNILTNAYEALKDKKGTILVQVKKRRNAFGVSVTDSGTGISAENLRRITSPFFTTKSKGTGLGLALCRQMAVMHGGKLKFTSVVDKGTTVTLSLPLRREG